ncbi:MAG TPA: penicillin-binding transpeptidase domain-containing protein, partial [Ilumatobacteraceae bacterium]
MNKQIRRLAAALLVCYIILFVQLNVLQVVKKSAIAANPNNNRAVLRDFDKPRGNIVTADGVVIADSVPSADTTYKYQRQYPTGDLFADVSGYYTFSFGATKLEKKYTDVLTGQTAAQQISAIANILSNKDNTGSVQLTMRNDLQQVAKDALGQREGSAIVMDPHTGAVLAMWSYPSYDPNDVAVHDPKRAQDVLTFLNASPGKPLLANAYQERYEPGSTFKVVTASIGLQDGVINLASSWPNEVSYLPPNTTKPIGNYHGEVCGGDLATVFARSCNTAFANVAVTVGADQMVAGTKAWGIGEQIPFDIPGAAVSHFGEVSDFKNSAALLALQGFGEGDDTMVPLQMALVAATDANGGVMMQPYVVAATLDHSGKVLSQTTPK